MVKHVKFIRVPSAIDALMPFDCLNSLIFSVVSHNFVSSGWNFMTLTLNIYDYSVVIKVKCQGVIPYRGVIVL